MWKGEGEGGGGSCSEYLVILCLSSWQIGEVGKLDVQAGAEMEEDDFGLGTQLAAEMLTDLVDQVPSTSETLYFCSKVIM